MSELSAGAPTAHVHPPAAVTGEPYAGRIDLGGRSLRRHTARGTMINGAFSVSLNLLGVVKGFLVAAFLTTGEYGVWGILLVSLGTLLWLKQVGISDRYIQQDEPDQALAFQKAFTLEVMLTGIFVVLLALAVPLVALVYGHEELLAPGIVVALMLPATALQAPVWVFYRKMDFLRQRSLQAIDPVVAFVVTVALAIAGAGYWSLVIGAFAGAWTGAVVSMLASPYPLRLRYDAGTMREYVDFSWPLVISGASGIVIAQGSVMLGERELGLAGAGAITLAATIAIYAERVDEIVTSTMYPAICAVKDRRDLLFESFVKSNRLALMWGVPFGIGLALFAPDLVEFGIGEQWEPAVLLLQVFGINAAIYQLGFNWDSFYYARGQTRPLAVVSLVTMLGFLAAVVPLLLTEGLSGYAIGMAVMSLVGLAARSFYLRRLFPGFAMLRHAARSIVPTIPAAAAVLLLRLAEGSERSLPIALGELVLFAAVTVAATAYIERPLIRELAGYLRNSPPTEPGVAT